MNTRIKDREDNICFARNMYRVVFAYALKETSGDEREKMYNRSYESAKNVLYKQYKIDDSRTQLCLSTNDSYDRANELSDRINKLYNKYKRYNNHSIKNCDEKVFFELINKYGYMQEYKEVSNDMICDINNYLPKTYKKSK